MSDIKQRLVELREIHGLSKAEFAQKLNINKSAITRWENGDVKPTLDILINISKTFNVSLDWLAGFDTDKEYEYNEILKKCLNSGISKEKLKKMIELMGE